jgi:hypothetical protein
MRVQLLLNRLVLASVLILSFSTICLSQKKRNIRDWEVGISVGGTRFLNSIDPNSDAVNKKFNYWNSDLNGSFALSVIKNISAQFSAEVQWQTTKLSGKWNENSGYAVPFSAISLGLPYPDPFKTGVNEFDLIFSINLNKIIAPKSKNDKWHVYLKGGGGVALLKGYKALFPYTTSGFPFKYSILYGTGVSYKIDEKIKFHLGFKIHKLETDRLDGIHTIKSYDPYEPISNVKEVFYCLNMGVSFNLAEFGKRSYGKNDLYPWFRPSTKKYKANRPSILQRFF